jgi:pimeloyl-ACP methyl ester carboxylesterase
VASPGKDRLPFGAMAPNGDERGTSARWADVNGIRVHCLTSGITGPPVVLLHGGGIDSASFTYGHLIAPLADGRRVYAPDWPGYGHSDKPNLGYTMSFYVDFLGHLMDALGLEKASLVGISMGGGAALGFALRSPQRVEQLILVDSYGLGSEVPWGRLGYLMVRAPLVDKLTYALLRRSRAMVRWSLYGLVHDRRKVTEGMVGETARLLEDPKAGRAWSSFQKSEVGWGGLRTDFSERLGALAVPTLLVHGAQDRAVPVAWARRAQGRIPDCELRVFPECGHLPPREQPEEFARVVEGFLSR